MSHADGVILLGFVVLLIGVGWVWSPGMACVVGGLICLLAGVAAAAKERNR